MKFKSSARLKNTAAVTAELLILVMAAVGFDQVYVPSSVLLGVRILSPAKGSSPSGVKPIGRSSGMTSSLDFAVEINKNILQAVS